MQLSLGSKRTLKERRRGNCFKIQTVSRKQKKGRRSLRAISPLTHPRFCFFDSKEPDWVVAHDLERRRAELNAHENELKQRIKAVREREAKLRSEHKRNEREGLNQDRRKKAVSRLRRNLMTSHEETEADLPFLSSPTQKRNASDSEESDSEFLASDFDSSDEGVNKVRSTFRKVKDEDDEHSNLSPAVRALMAELDASRKSNSRNVEEEEPEKNPKIFYVSRTHSQLSQFVSELRKTKFGKQIKMKQFDESGNSTMGNEKEVDLDWEPIRTVSLGSRKQMCINESVQKIGKRAGTEAMNERCRELAKGGESEAVRVARLIWLVLILSIVESPRFLFNP